MIATVLVAASLILGPYYGPDPTPGFQDPNNLSPTYITNGDGTRIQCTPTANACWTDTSGLPSYLQGE